LGEAGEAEFFADGAGGIFSDTGALGGIVPEVGESFAPAFDVFGGNEEGGFAVMDVIADACHFGNGDCLTACHGAEEDGLTGGEARAEEGDGVEGCPGDEVVGFVVSGVVFDGDVRGNGNAAEGGFVSGNDGEREVCAGDGF